MPQDKCGSCLPGGWTWAAKGAARNVAFKYNLRSRYLTLLLPRRRPFRRTAFNHAASHSGHLAAWMVSTPFTEVGKRGPNSGLISGLGRHRGRVHRPTGTRCTWRESEPRATCLTGQRIGWTEDGRSAAARASITARLRQGITLNQWRGRHLAPFLPYSNGHPEPRSFLRVQPRCSTGS
jgi:hypothetical protein